MVVGLGCVCRAEEVVGKSLPGAFIGAGHIITIS